MINQFQGPYRWLSNFAPCNIRLGKRNFPSVEHAYMSCKSHDLEWKNTCSQGNHKPGKIKRMSRKISLRNDWNLIKLQVMENCLRIKFNQEPYKSKLLSTGDQYIQEGNFWNDKFWGVCLKTHKGENNLGKLIMKIRKELKEPSNETNNN